jgi:hypothetical protein
MSRMHAESSRAAPHRSARPAHKAELSKGLQQAAKDVTKRLANLLMLGYLALDDHHAAGALRAHGQGAPQARRPAMPCAAPRPSRCPRSRSRPRAALSAGEGARDRSARAPPKRCTCTPCAAPARASGGALTALLPRHRIQPEPAPGRQCAFTLPSRYRRRAALPRRPRHRHGRQPAVLTFTATQESPWPRRKRRAKPRRLTAQKPPATCRPRGRSRRAKPADVDDADAEGRAAGRCAPGTGRSASTSTRSTCTPTRRRTPSSRSRSSSWSSRRSTRARTSTSRRCRSSPRSMRGVGVMQAILVRPVTLPGGFEITRGGEPLQAYEIIFGHRRYRAAKLAGWPRARASCANSPTRRPRSCRRSRTCSARTWTRSTRRAATSTTSRCTASARTSSPPRSACRARTSTAASSCSTRCRPCRTRCAPARSAPRSRCSSRGSTRRSCRRRRSRRSRASTTTWKTAARRASARSATCCARSSRSSSRRDLRHEADRPAAARRQLHHVHEAHGQRARVRDLAGDTRKGLRRPARRAARPDLCTDPDCFEAKKKAHLANKAAELEAKGKTVITGGKARSGDQRRRRSQGRLHRAQGREGRSPRRERRPRASTSAVVTIQNPRDGKTKEAVAVADLKAAGVKVKARRGASGGGYDYEEERASARRRRRKREVAVPRRRSTRPILAAVRQAAAGQPLTTLALQHIALVAFAAWREQRNLLAQLHGLQERSTRSQEDRSDAAESSPRCCSIARWSHNVVASGVRDDKPDALLAAAKHSASTSPQIRKEVAASRPTPRPRTCSQAASRPRKKRPPRPDPFTTGDPMLTIEHCENLTSSCRANRLSARILSAGHRAGHGGERHAAPCRRRADVRNAAGPGRDLARRRRPLRRHDARAIGGSPGYHLIVAERASTLAKIKWGPYDHDVPAPATTTTAWPTRGPHGERAARAHPAARGRRRRGRRALRLLPAGAQRADADVDLRAAPVQQGGLVLVEHAVLARLRLGAGLRGRHSYIYRKDNELRAVAVRRLVL